MPKKAFLPVLLLLLFSPGAFANYNDNLVKVDLNTIDNGSEYSRSSTQSITLVHTVTKLDAALTSATISILKYKAGNNYEIISGPLTMDFASLPAGSVVTFLPRFISLSSLQNGTNTFSVVISSTTPQDFEPLDNIDNVSIIVFDNAKMVVPETHPVLALLAALFVLAILRRKA